MQVESIVDHREIRKYPRAMWRFLALITAISLLTLSSCATVGGNEEKESVSVERERAAIELLSLDMFSSLSSFSFDSEILSEALPSSFSIYEEYVPSYDTLTEKYLSDVAKVATEAVESYMPVIKERALEMAKDPMEYISGDTTLTDALKKLMGGELSAVVYDTLFERKEYLDESFLTVSRIFNEIRKGYASLESVGKGEYLPEAMSILLDNASMIVSDAFFTSLGSVEKTLKNTPVSSNSPYAVFWE